MDLQHISPQSKRFGHNRTFDGTSESGQTDPSGAVASRSDDGNMMMEEACAQK